MVTDATIAEHFLPHWRRPRRENDATNCMANSFWRHYPCLVCGKPAPTPADTTASPVAGADPNSEEIKSDLQESLNNAAKFSTNPFDPDYQKPPPKALKEEIPLPSSSSSTDDNNRHKRCSRCHSAIYCSASCQKTDYIRGKHKASCLALGKLWEEKGRLENLLWGLDERNDDKTDYPIVGKFWTDHPEPTGNHSKQKECIEYCGVLLQLVQLLGRAEAWRVSRIPPSSAWNDKKTGLANYLYQRGPINPLARELALDLAFTLLYLDRTDMRVRLLIPSLLLMDGEPGGRCVGEAYDYLKYWLRAETSMMVMDLALMGGGDDWKEEIPFLGDRGNDILELPEKWMDGDMVYPSVGMVFELAFLKCHLLVLLKDGYFERIVLDERGGLQDDEIRGSASSDIVGDDGSDVVRDFTNGSHEDITTLSFAKRAVEVGEKELRRQVYLLLSLVHKWNPHLLPALGEPYNITTGASSSSSCTTKPDNQSRNCNTDGRSIFIPPTPPALSTLLDKQPPGFELQYRMGNAGGQSFDEAVSIWQRDMILWHYVNPKTMMILSEFCSDLENNIMDVSGLTGCSDIGRGVDVVDSSGSGRNDEKSRIEDSNSNIMEDAKKRKEAEDLVAKLQKENPDRTLDQIMMHPEMAQLMIKHLHNKN
ncbi:hypothetical protein ACHAXS_005524 [Conticribra weissflogii]